MDTVYDVITDRPNAIARNIERGWAMFDRVQPGWRKRVRPSYIDMSDAWMCVLAQVYADAALDGAATPYSFGLAAMIIASGETVTTSRERDAFAIRHGWMSGEVKGTRQTFDISDCELRTAWIGSFDF